MKVLTASNGRDALRIVEDTPDLAIILMDIMMPEMDGYEVIETIRERPNLRVGFPGFFKIADGTGRKNNRVAHYRLSGDVLARNSSITSRRGRTRPASESAMPSFTAATVWRYSSAASSGEGLN